MTTEDPYEVLTAYQKSAAVMAAGKCGIFEALGDQSRTAADIASRLGLDIYATGVLLDALATCGYVDSDEHGYLHNDFSRNFSMDNSGILARIVHKEKFFYDKWADLASSIKTGKARLASYAERCEKSPAEIKMFLSALNDIAAMGADGVLGAAKLPDAGTLLDYGGGMGGYAIKIHRKHPGLKISLLDCPLVAGFCREHLENVNLLDSVEVLEGDLFDDVSAMDAGGYDIVFVSHIIHDYPPKQAAEVIASAAKRVKKGGRLYLLDVPKPAVDGDRAEALFDVMMLVEAPGGRTHADANIRKWISATGLSVRNYTKLFFGALYEAR